jgi:hypothetical protein
MSASALPRKRASGFGKRSKGHIKLEAARESGPADGLKT